MTWEKLKETYAERGLVLAFGTGVSLGSGLPDWVGLLERIAQDECCLGRDGRKLVTRLRERGFGLPAIAGMLRARCPNRECFPELVRRCLYRGFLQRRKRWGNLIEFTQNENKTLAAVGALCAIGNRDGSFEKNPLIHAIVNFNMDAVFRAYVRERYSPANNGHLLVRTIERASKSRHPEKINVYYMHGFLHFDRNAGKADEEASDNLVLAEHEYFDFFNNPTGLFNYTFLHLLREHSCLFIGLSMQDDNIRRLLHYSAQERIQGYLAEGKPMDRAAEKTCRHFAILQWDNENIEVNHIIEASLAELGTQVLWVRNFNEIPEKLGAVYEAGEGKWGLVYSS